MLKFILNSVWKRLGFVTAIIAMNVIIAGGGFELYRHMGAIKEDYVMTFFGFVVWMILHNLIFAAAICIVGLAIYLIVKTIIWIINGDW